MNKGTPADPLREAERKAFEKWADREIGRTWLFHAPGRTDEYEDSHTNMAWFVWQARAALATKPAETPEQTSPSVQPLAPEPPDRNMEGAREFVNAIMSGAPIWPNPWGQDVACAAYFIHRERTGAQRGAALTDAADARRYRWLTACKRVPWGQFLDNAHEVGIDAAIDAALALSPERPDPPAPSTTGEKP